MNIVVNIVIQGKIYCLILLILLHYDGPSCWGLLDLIGAFGFDICIAVESRSLLVRIQILNLLVLIRLQRQKLR